MKGKIVDWKDERGFGFIESESGSRLFFHISDLGHGALRPTIGTFVYYDLVKGKEGKFRAANVSPTDQKLRRPPPNKVRGSTSAAQRSAFAITAVLTFPFLWWLAQMGWVSIKLLWVFIGMSGFTFLLYGWDKSSARLDVQRTPEKTLQICSLMCGWPGGLLAQQIFRHKTKKASFQTVFWSTVVLNVAAVVFMFSPVGVSLLQW